MPERERDACPKCAHTTLTFLYQSGPPEHLGVSCETCHYEWRRPCADDATDPIDRIQRFVCNHYGVTKPHLLSRDRHKTVVVARQVACYLARTTITPEPSYPELARRFGDRDHTTIMQSVKRGEAIVAAEPHLRSLLDGADADPQLALPGIAKTTTDHRRFRVA